MTISALAGIGRPVTGPLMTSTGWPRMPPTMSNSLTPSGTSLQPIRKLIGSPPQTIATGMRSPRACVFVAHLAAVLAGRDVEAERLLVVDHDAVGAAIDPAVVGIAHDVVAAGADIAAAVLRVPLRRREFGDVDVVALHDVLASSGRSSTNFGGMRLSIGRRELTRKPSLSSSLERSVGKPSVMFLRLPAKKLTSRRLPLSVPGTSSNTKHGASSSCADISATMPMSAARSGPPTSFTSPSLFASSSHWRRSS